ncbi:MAG: LysR substrate-binding domain-containing protein [Myxococcota bacterium]
MTNLDRAPQMLMFAILVEQGSFTKAAHLLRVSKSHLSKQIQQLEEHLGLQLLDRTTRRVSPTESGRVFFQSCVLIRDAVVKGEFLVHEAQEQMLGKLKISVPLSFGQRFLQKPLIEFLAEYPGIDAEIELSDAVVDLAMGGFDLGVRIGPVKPSLVSRELCRSRRLVVASPGFWSKHAIECPSELADKPCLLYAHQELEDIWVVRGASGPTRVHVNGRLRCNNGDLLADAAICGFGFAWLPDFIVTTAVERGDLVVAFSGSDDATEMVSVITTNHSNVSKKVSALIEHLARHLTGA